LPDDIDEIKDSNANNEQFSGAVYDVTVMAARIAGQSVIDVAKDNDITPDDDTVQNAVYSAARVAAEKMVGETDVAERMAKAATDEAMQEYLENDDDDDDYSDNNILDEPLFPGERPKADMSKLSSSVSGLLNTISENRAKRRAKKQQEAELNASDDDDSNNWHEHEDDTYNNINENTDDTNSNNNKINKPSIISFFFRKKNHKPKPPIGAPKLPRGS